MKKLGGLRKRIDAKATDVKINLAAIIDCMVVILAYLLISGSFIGLGIFDVKFEGSAENLEKEEREKIKQEIAEEASNSDVLIIKIEKENFIKIYSAKNEFETKEIASLENKKVDYEGYLLTLKEVKEKYPHIKLVALNPHRGLYYKDLMKTLETTKVYYTAIWMEQ